MREFTAADPMLTERSPGYVTARCRKHPQKRWFMKDPRGASNRISQNPGLHFLGDLESGLVACPFQKPRDKEYVANMAEAGFSHECLCPFSQLEYEATPGQWEAV